MDKLLEVKNLRVVLDGTVIVEHVNFELYEGEVIAFIGPNGSGKTTVLRALLGLVPYSGEILWTGSPRIGYVPQRFQTDRNLPLTVEEFLMLESGSQKNESRAKLEECLAEVGVEKTKQKRLADLSGGQLQRVLIARALMTDPDIFLFDEPTSGIDIGAEETVYVLLKRIADARRLSVLLVSHELNVVYRFADKVICINKEMVCCGKPQEVLTPEQLTALYQNHAAFYGHKHEHPRQRGP